jgi:hypothetical protein
MKGSPFSCKEMRWEGARGCRRIMLLAKLAEENFLRNYRLKWTCHRRNALIQASNGRDSLPAAIADAANKILLESSATWRAFANIKTAHDFKNQTANRKATPASWPRLLPAVKSNTEA